MQNVGYIVTFLACLVSGNAFARNPTPKTAVVPVGGMMHTNELPKGLKLDSGSLRGSGGIALNVAPPPIPAAALQKASAPAQPAAPTLNFGSLSQKPQEANSPMLASALPLPTPATSMPPRVDAVNDAGEINILLIDGKFHPTTVRLKSGQNVKLLFAAVQKNSATLVVEQSQIQNLIAKIPLVNSRITEIPLEPTKGSYQFRDTVSGARGQIVVE